MDPLPLTDDVAAMAFVQASSLCNGLPASALEQLFAGGVVLEAAPGVVLVREGDTDDDLFMILDGTVRVLKQRGDESVELAVLERPGIFGETSAISGQPRTASVVAAMDARLIRIAGSAVRAAADSAPKLGRRLAALMAGRSRDTEAKTSA